MSMPNIENGATWLPVIVEIKNLKTGEIRNYEDTLYKTDDYDGIFIWEDGNFACDCNRANFFARAGGESDVDIGCNVGTNQYQVRIKDGDTVLYSEFGIPENEVEL